MNLSRLIEFDARVEEFEEMGPRFGELLDLIEDHLKDADEKVRPMMVERLFQNMDQRHMEYWKGWFESVLEKMGSQKRHRKYKK